jgi:hypothetical protein
LAVIREVTGFLSKKVSKIRGRKVGAVARSIEHTLLFVGPWEDKKMFRFHAKNASFRFVSFLG